MYMQEHHPNDRSLKTNPCLILLPASESDLDDEVVAQWWNDGYISTYEELREHIYGYIEWSLQVKIGRGDNLERLTTRKLMAWVWILGYESLSNRIRTWYDTAYTDSGLPAIRMICEEFGWMALSQQIN